VFDVSTGLPRCITTLTWSR